MKCEDCRVLLEEYFDRVLDGKRAEKVRVHLQTCSACSEELQQLAREQQMYSRYERDVDVTPDLWTSIERRIRTEAVRETLPAVNQRPRLFDFLASWRLNPALVALILVIAVGATVIVTQYIERRSSTNGQPGKPDEVAKVNGKPDAEAPSPGVTPGSGPSPTEAGDTSGPKTVAGSPSVAGRVPRAARKPSPAELIRDAEQKYLNAIAILTRDVKNRANTLDPQARNRFETTLAIIDNTIEETRQAVRKNPGDPIALQYLMGSYSRKVDVLREMARQ